MSGGRRGVGGLAAAAALVLGGCRATEAGETASAPEVAPVERTTLDVRAEAAGLVEPIRVVEVKSKASGEVLRLLVETGDRVEKGALLAEVDPRDVRNALAQAEADLEVARARLATAEAQRARTEELRQANVVTEQELEAARLEEANARSQFVKARTNLELARERMGDVTIRAPVAGTVIQKSVEAGQIIASASGNVSGGTTLMLMADLSEMQVRTLVDETDIGRIQPGMPARVTVEAHSTRTFQGAVHKIEPQAVVEQNVTMFPVLVRIDNREGLLRPGMNAEVQVEIARRENVLVVPNAAVVSMRDVAAAAGALGLDPESLRGPTGRPLAGSVEPGSPAAPTEGESPTSREGGSPAGRIALAAPDGQEPAPTAAAVEGAPDPAACAGLRERVRSVGREGLSAPERELARRCLEAFRAREGATAGTGRPAMVFVAGASGPEPRRVLIGLNDWDNTEVVSGLEDGDRVYLISVARLQQQQQEMMDRIRQRNNPFGGSGGGRGR